MPETKTDTDQLTIESDTDKTKIETDTDKIETCNMHTLVYPTYLLRPPPRSGSEKNSRVQKNSRIETKNRNKIERIM